MAEFRVELRITSIHPKKQTESLLCRAVLRSIPGRRQVYDAVWDGRDVIAKVFSDRFSAKRHVRREWRGLDELAKRGVPAPSALFHGKTQDGRWAIVVQKIPLASTALDILNETPDDASKLSLLMVVCKELAKQHESGILQKDLHLGNFLLAGDKVFALDPAQMRFYSQPIRRKKSLSQLALSAHYLSSTDSDSIHRLWKAYFAVRGWHLGEADEQRLRRQMMTVLKRGIRRRLKKSLRTSKRYLRVRPAGFLAVVDRAFCRGAEPLDFIQHVDALMDSGQVLKKGNTCTVCRLSWNGHDIVVKRYNHKGFVHSLRHTIKRSRARRAWLHAHRLGVLNITTPKPLAYIEERRRGLVWKSYLVTRYVDGQTLYEFLRNGISEEERSRASQQVSDLLKTLATYGISHGDLKHSNILVTGSGAVLTDLDGMKVHRFNWLLKIRRAKDAARLAESIPRCESI